MFSKILVAVDGSANSRLAVQAAVELAKCCSAGNVLTHVVLTHVIRDLALPKEIMAMIASGEITESRLELLENSAEIILDNAARPFAEAGLSAQVEKVILHGDPAWQIANHARAQGIDLIVVGYRGLDTQSNMLGGMARKLINLTTISCLVVK
ncbi:MAG: hypothetical protein AUK03_07220 [Anaerolineae bacterium CG2_30_64_16]|nr:MAG: hypothetical protein AUK03_07220 [Anaerolineae bacterium CG2_30_64_16]